MQEVEKALLNAEDVAELLGVKLTTAYRVIRDLNKKLAESGKLVIRGRVNKQYLLKTLDTSDVG